MQFLLVGVVSDDDRESLSATESPPTTFFNKEHFLLDRFPTAVFPAPDDGLDHAHVSDSVFDWRRNGRVVEDGLGEEIGLNAVLIADVEFNVLDLFVNFQPGPARPASSSAGPRADAD